jgi:hypothetical protein
LQTALDPATRARAVGPAVSDRCGSVDPPGAHHRKFSPPTVGVAIQGPSHAHIIDSLRKFGRWPKRFPPEAASHGTARRKPSSLQVPPSAVGPFLRNRFRMEAMSRRRRSCLVRTGQLRLRVVRAGARSRPPRRLGFGTPGSASGRGHLHPRDLPGVPPVTNARGGQLGNGAIGEARYHASKSWVSLWTTAYRPFLSC